MRYLLHAADVVKAVYTADVNSCTRRTPTKDEFKAPSGVSLFRLWAAIPTSFFISSFLSNSLL